MLAGGAALTCAQAARALLADPRRWEIRSAGAGAKGDRWYGWALLSTASPRHRLLIRRHLRPANWPSTTASCPRASRDQDPADPRSRAALAGEEDFGFGKDARPGRFPGPAYTAIARHTVLVMAALAICAVTAALLRDRTDTQAPAPVRPGQQPPADPGMIPLTVPQIKRLLAALATRPPARAHRLVGPWTRRHQARARWFHQRTRLARDAEIALVSEGSGMPVAVLSGRERKP